MREMSLHVIVLTCFMAACAPGDGPVSSVEQAGRWQQGRWQQGYMQQGSSLVGFQYQGVQIGGEAVQGVQLQGTSLSGQIINGGSTQAVSGMDFVGATLVGVDGSGNQSQQMIQDIAVDPADPSGQTLLYTLASYNAASGAWQNICEPDPSGAQLAIPLAGVWNSDGSHSDSAQLFTFGCTSGSLGKCVLWGYPPWETYAGQSLAPFHQACTRMARADYCGDGTPHTENGTWIDIYDVLGIETQVPNDGMLFEAAWIPDGAYCISKARWNLIATEVLTECPQKIVPPSLSNLLNEDSCIIQLSSASRSTVLMSDRSDINIEISL